MRVMEAVLASYPPVELPDREISGIFSISIKARPWQGF